MEHEINNAFHISVGLGVILAAGWIASLLLCGIWNRAWAWIDDSKPSSHNAMVAKVMQWLGYQKDDGSYGYTKVKEVVQLTRGTHTSYKYSDGGEGFFYPLIILFAGPTIILLAIAIYPVTIGIATAFALARLARFARRHKKLFDKHIKDPDAHK